MHKQHMHSLCLCWMESRRKQAQGQDKDKDEDKDKYKDKDKRNDKHKKRHSKSTAQHKHKHKRKHKQTRHARQVQQGRNGVVAGGAAPMPSAPRMMAMVEHSNAIMSHRQALPAWPDHDLHHLHC